MCENEYTMFKLSFFSICFTILDCIVLDLPDEASRFFDIGLQIIERTPLNDDQRELYLCILNNAFLSYKD